MKETTEARAAFAKLFRTSQHFTHDTYICGNVTAGEVRALLTEYARLQAVEDRYKALRGTE